MATYAPSVNDNSGAIRAEGKKKWGEAAMTVANAFAGAVGSYAGTLKESQAMQGQMESMAQDDPEIAQLLPKFAEASHGKKKGIYADAMLRKQQQLDTEKQDAALNQSLAAYAGKRQIDAQYAKPPAPEFGPGDYATLEDGGRINKRSGAISYPPAYTQKPEMTGPPHVQTMEVPETDYVMPVINGKPSNQLIPKTGSKAKQPVEVPEGFEKQSATINGVRFARPTVDGILQTDPADPTTRKPVRGFDANLWEVDAAGNLVRKRAGSGGAVAAPMGVWNYFP